MSKPKRIKRDVPRGPLRLYRSYVFKNKDPVIDEMRTLVQDNFGSITHKALKQIEADGGPTVACMDNWFKGDTRRPQSASIEAAGRAMGMKRVWVRNNNGKKDNGG